MKSITIPIDVPEELEELIKKRVEKIISDEITTLKMFLIARERLKLSDKDLEILENARSEAWQEWKKKYGL